MTGQSNAKSGCKGLRTWRCWLFQASESTGVIMPVWHNGEPLNRAVIQKFSGLNALE